MVVAFKSIALVAASEVIASAAVSQEVHSGRIVAGS